MNEGPNPPTADTEAYFKHDGEKPEDRHISMPHLWSKYRKPKAGSTPAPEAEDTLEVDLGHLVREGVDPLRKKVMRLMRAKKWQWCKVSGCTAAGRVHRI